MKKLKPKNYIKIHWEEKEGYPFKQPIEKLNGKTYSDSSEEVKSNWANYYWDSQKYDRAIEVSKYNSSLWKSNKIKNKAFEIIYNFIKNKQYTGSITALFPFEIYMLNDGFKMMSFDCLTSLHPGLNINCEKYTEEGKYINVKNPKGILLSRLYKKDDKIIYLGFGLNNVNFYFSVDNNYYQVDNNIENYENAINGKLKKL